MLRTTVFLLMLMALNIPPGTLCAQNTAHLQRAELPVYEISSASAPRLFAYTNRRSAMYCGVLNGGNSSRFHGIAQSERKLFENYWIQFGEVLLDSRLAHVRVTPAGFVRYYPLHNTEEHVAFSDSLALLTVSIKTDYRGEVRIYPGWSQWQDAVETIGNGMYALRDSSIQAAAAVQGVRGEWEIARPSDVQQFANPAPMHIPACFIGETDGVMHLTIETAPPEMRLSPRSPRELFRITKRKQLAISDFLATLDFACSDSATTSAFNWIAASMRTLLMRQHDAEFTAGLPCFDDDRGRDTFITLPQALLVTGQFETAREVLRSCFHAIDRDSGSASYGRIPHRLAQDAVIGYAADGTARTVISSWEYFRVSGDSSFLRDIYPDIRRSIQGALRYTDASGFLTHADAATWMNAVGPNGPYSPRGNRAVEMQALWHGQLLSAAAIAEVLDDTARSGRWKLLARQLATAFRTHFISTEQHDPPSSEEQRPSLPAARLIPDHLNADGTADSMLRPNALIVLTEGNLLAGVDSIRLQRFAGDLLSSITYPWGIASLSSHEDQFQPRYQSPHVYAIDAAKHNGLVWTWLSGPAVSILTSYGLADSAWILTRTLQRYAMESGAVGNLPERIDALPHPGAAWPRWSGAFAHAGSSAAYMRNMYADYLGFRPGRDAQGPTLTLCPHLPSVLTFAESSTRIGSTRLHVRYDVVREIGAIGSLLCTVTMLDGRDTLRIKPPQNAGDTLRFDAFLLGPGERHRFRIIGADNTAGEAFRERFHFAIPPIQQ